MKSEITNNGRDIILIPETKIEQNQLTIWIHHIFSKSYRKSDLICTLRTGEINDSDFIGNGNNFLIQCHKCKISNNVINHSNRNIICGNCKSILHQDYKSKCVIHFGGVCTCDENPNIPDDYEGGFTFVRNDPNTPPPTKRPALGIIPERLWKEKRLAELKSTIRRRIKNGDILLHTWIKEYNKLLRELKR